MGRKTSFPPKEPTEPAAEFKQYLMTVAIGSSPLAYVPLTVWASTVDNARAIVTENFGGNFKITKIAEAPPR